MTEPRIPATRANGRVAYVFTPAVVLVRYEGTGGAPVGVRLLPNPVWRVLAEYVARRVIARVIHLTIHLWKVPRS